MGKRLIAPLWVRLRLLVAALMVLLAGSLAGHAAPLKRHVLAIYDSSAEHSSAETMVHLRLEMPLNHLGFVVDYTDARAGLPSPDDADQYAAVVTWFTYELPQPTEYLLWARKMSERGIPFIIFGGIGVPTTPQNIAMLNNILAPMGIAYTTGYVESTDGTSVVVEDPKVIGYERPLDTLLPPYPIIRRISADAEVALEVQASVTERRAKSAIVTAGAGGAFVPGPYGMFVDPVLDRTQWLVNPFEIIRRTLGGELAPIPDTTTVSGRRLFFSHVDGDGWNDNVEIQRYRNRLLRAADVLAAELIEPYPDLPVTVAVIAADLDPVLGGGESAQEVARTVFALPQVEMGSHTNTAPIDWQFYEHYDRAAEEGLVEVPSALPNDSWLGRIGRALGLIQPRSASETTRSQYLVGSRKLPRAFLRDPFSIESEVGGSVAEIDKYAPEGKHVKIYQWTGDSLPFEAIINATRQAGLRNINGGGSRFDTEYPSVGYVSPIARSVGAERQIYALDANENTFSSDWTQNFNGLSSLRLTIDNTEQPVRLKGVDIYYHAYSAKKQASLSAVRGLLDWARGERLAPITASAYASIADGFFSTRIEQVSATSWLVSNRDGLNTVRFDDAASIEVDLSKSEGVVGSTMYAGSLYVTLDPDVGNAVVSLRPKQATPEQPSGVDDVMLDNSRWAVSGIHRHQCEFLFTASGYGKGEFEWRDLQPGTYVGEARRGPERVWSDKLVVGSDGHLAMNIDAPGIDPLSVKVTCEAGVTGRAS